MHSKETFEIPSLEDLTDDKSHTGVLEWIEDDWSLDTSWAATDLDGWEYYNQRWETPRATRMLGSFTRRRKWIRHLKLVENK